MSESKKFLVGVFDDDDVILKAIPKIRAGGVKIQEVYSPFPIHGIDPALGIKRSRLPKAAFLFGMTGTSLALFMQIYMIGFDWPMNIGGKDFISFPDFIPLTFEITVLLSALGMVTTFMLASKLGPGSNKMILDKRYSDNKFIMGIELSANTKNEDEITSLLKENGASEVNLKEV